MDQGIYNDVGPLLARSVKRTEAPMLHKSWKKTRKLLLAVSWSACLTPYQTHALSQATSTA